MTDQQCGRNNKPVFARLTPSMTREQMEMNLITALEKSGFTIRPNAKQPDEGDAI